MIPSMRPPRWALMTGLVRDAGGYLEKLRLLEGWLRGGMISGIVASTWEGELDKHPEVSLELARLGALVVESPEMDLVLPGSFLHQVRTIRAGLAMVPQGALVLRLRSDKCELAESDHSCFDLADSPARSPFSHSPAVFRNRMAVPGAQLLTPFFLVDQVFCALREDLWELCSYDLRLEIEGSEVIPEQMLYARPFLDRIEVFDLHFRMQRRLFGYPMAIWRHLRDGSLASPVFLEILAAWLQILDTHFRVGFRTVGPIDWASWSLETQLDAQDGDRCIGFSSAAVTLAFERDDWIGPLLSGQTVQDPTTRRLLEALERLQSGTQTPWHPGSASIPPQAEDLRRFYEAVLGPGGKLPVARAGRVRLGGAAPRWRIHGSP